MIRVLLFVLLYTWVHDVSAQTVRAKGIATVSYKSRLDPATRERALREAALSAVEAHVAETSAAKARLFDERRDEFARQIDSVVRVHP